PRDRLRRGHGLPAHARGPARAAARDRPAGGGPLPPRQPDRPRPRGAHARGDRGEHRGRDHRPPVGWPRGAAERDRGTHPPHVAGGAVRPLAANVDPRPDHDLKAQPEKKESTMTRISVHVDGVQYTDEVEPRTLLVHYLRERLGKTGTVVGCDTSNCGACTVHLDGASVKSCTVLAVQADGRDVATVEGLSADGELHPMQEAF